MNELHLFSGAGGGILGGILIGHTCVCAVEIAPYCREVLLQRQRDGILPKFPIWDDVKTFNGKPWKGLVDVVCGGFPCQDISAAGRGAGIEGAKSGLWKEYARVVCEVRPQFVFVENSPMLTVRGLGRVLGDLASMRYNARWGCFTASSIGAEHERERIFILASNSNSPQRKGRGISSGVYTQNTNPGHTRWGKDKPRVDRVVDGVAHRLDRLKAIGNGQVPACVELAWKTLMQTDDSVPTADSTPTPSPSESALSQLRVENKKLGEQSQEELDLDAAYRHGHQDAMEETSEERCSLLQVNQMLCEALIKIEILSDRGMGNAVGDIARAALASTKEGK